ncbi:hypothetical protein, partial [Xanthomonas euvesicatoria]|uniref:hypothetical protein n=1 Tax=Xanthomonas euvesicatoria TaxID=456327 RepID=UPI0019D26FD0
IPGVGIHMCTLSGYLQRNLTSSRFGVSGKKLPVTASCATHGPLGPHVAHEAVTGNFFPLTPKRELVRFL